MKKYCLLLASASLFVASSTPAITLDDIQVWSGTGTNRAALVIYWIAPEVPNGTVVPNPVAEKSLVWGYRWNGVATAENMLDAVAAVDHRLFAVISPPSAFGTFPYALGYDLNNNGVFGIKSVTNVFAESSFTNGLRTLTTEDPDDSQPLDAGDIFWSGSFGPSWELWQEQGGTGGFTNAPDRGPNAYWTPDDPTAPYSGHHGQWALAQSGMSSIALQNGSWIGWTVAAGGFDFFNPTAPGTIAYGLHKHAPPLPTAASTNVPYAAQVIASQGPFGASPYDDPACVLGAPSSRFYESTSKPATRVKMVEAAYNYSVMNGQTNKLIVTLNNGSSIIARFDHPVLDNPANPYGIDFIVFGNTFFTGTGFTSDSANFNTFNMTGGSFSEPTKISVSPGYTGQPGEDPGNPATWPWYRYENGPYGDTVFPTQAYKWNRAGTNWTEELLDYTKPVNPVLQTRFAAGSLSVADGIDLYDGSGGGTGFDLGVSGFASIRYIKAEGISPGFSAGEIDALTIVRPMTIGDELSIAPANLTNNTAHLFFQDPGDTSRNLVSLAFTSIDALAKVTTARLDNPAALAPVTGLPVNAVQLGLAPLLGTTAVGFQADLTLSAGGSYTGSGGDLRVTRWSGTNWTQQAFAYSPADHSLVVAGVTNLSAFVVAQVVAPRLDIHSNTNGFVFQFIPVPNCSHTLERSTDFATWTGLITLTPTNAQPVTLQDNAAPAGKAFYRLHLNP
jgi:hypothetical protein